MTATHRKTTALMRFALLLGTVLTFGAGFQLYVLTESTDRFFAWTIGAGSNATIIGSFYWTACVLSFLSWRRRPWALARVGVPGVAAFLWATLFTTIAHLDKFHLHDQSTGRIAAWAWLVIYVLDPILVSVAWALQHRVSGSDPERAETLGQTYRLALAGAGTVFGALGLVMLIAPQLIIDLAPFPLTSLTGRTIGAWVLAMGIVFATMAWENDRKRIQPAAVAAVVAPALLAIGTFRYWDEFTWGTAGWVYGVSVATIGVLGVVGLMPGLRQRREAT